MDEGKEERREGIHKVARARRWFYFLFPVGLVGGLGVGRQWTDTFDGRARIAAYEPSVQHTTVDTCTTAAVGTYVTILHDITTVCTT